MLSNDRGCEVATSLIQINLDVFASRISDDEIGSAITVKVCNGKAVEIEQSKASWNIFACGLLRGSGEDCRSGEGRKKAGEECGFHQYYSALEFVESAYVIKRPVVDQTDFARIDSVGR